MSSIDTYATTPYVFEPKQGWLDKENCIISIMYTSIAMRRFLYAYA